MNQERVKLFLDSYAGRRELKPALLLDHYLKNGKKVVPIMNEIQFVIA